MKCLKRNKSAFWYSLYKEEAMKTDNGYYTGEVGITYTDPVRAEANISVPSGNVFVDRFGNSIDYDKVIVTDDIDIPIAEDSILFIDRDPEKDTSGNWIYDYVVKRVAKSLNSVSIYVSKRSVS